MISKLIKTILLCQLSLLTIFACVNSACDSASSQQDTDSGLADAKVDDGDGSTGMDAGDTDGGGEPSDGEGIDAGLDAGGDLVEDAGSDGDMLYDGGGDMGGDLGDGTESDAGGDFTPDAGNDSGDEDTYSRASLSTCWTDATCPRVMAIGHGGLWNLSSTPYDSNAALIAAYQAGMDGVKIDVRVTADNVPVISHSSPLEIYESLDCSGRRIEEMTAAEVTSCHRFPSSTETFQRLDDVLEYLRGKMVVQLCVKESRDYQRTIEEIHALGAEDFAFMEISTSELQDMIPSLEGSDTVYYLINVKSNMGEIDTLIDTINNPRAFMYEFDTDAPIGDLVSTRLHPAGVRAFTYDKADMATAARFEGYYNAGYDVVSANAGNSVIEARININQARGVDPP